MQRSEWLRIHHFDANPFGGRVVSQGTEPDLPSYYVPLDVFEQLIDPEVVATSTMVHGQSGDGKSALGRMVARHLRQLSPTPRLLVAELDDWGEVQRSRSSRDFDEALPHAAALLLAVNRELAAAGHETLAVPPSRFAAQELAGLASYVRHLGFDACHVVLDGVDEAVPTSANRALDAADLLAPLVARRGLHQIPGLVLHYFISTAVYQQLAERQQVRDEVLDIHEIIWSDEMLAELLRERLHYFSQGRVQSLNTILAADVDNTVDVDQLLVRVARRNPRRLLQFGNELVIFAAQRATPDALRLPTHHYAEFVTRCSPDRQRRAESLVPLDLSEKTAVVSELVQRLPGGADWTDALSRLTADVHSTVMDKLPDWRGKARQDAMFDVVTFFNSYTWLTTLPLVHHPLLVFLEAAQFLFEAYPIEKIKQASARVTARLEEWERSAGLA